MSAILLEERRSRATEQPDLLGKRTAVIVFSYYPSDTRVLRASEALRNAGMEVDLLCILERPDEARREVVNGVNVHRVGLLKRRSSRLAYMFQYAYFLWAAFWWLSTRTISRRYNLVHVHNMPDILVFSALLAKPLGARVILDLHDPTPEVFMAIYDLPPQAWITRVLHWLERWSIGFADKVLTTNIAFSECFVSRGCPPSKIEVIMNSPLASIFHLPPERIKPRHSDGEGETFVLMHHGTLVERHGLHIAVRAVAQLRARIPGLRFHIYGQHTAYMRETVCPLISRLGLDDIVQCFGEQPQNVIASAIADCDLGIVPNLRTVFTEINMPTRLFEYLALHKPVIAPDTRGIRDYFDASQMLFFPPGDVAALARRIAWVYEHPQATAKLVQAGRDVYVGHLWEDEKARFLVCAKDLCCR